MALNSKFYLKISLGNLPDKTLFISGFSSFRVIPKKTEILACLRVKERRLNVTLTVPRSEVTKNRRGMKPGEESTSRKRKGKKTRDYNSETRRGRKRGGRAVDIVKLLPQFPRTLTDLEMNPDPILADTDVYPDPILADTDVYPGPILADTDIYPDSILADTDVYPQHILTDSDLLISTHSGEFQTVDMSTKPILEQLVDENVEEGTTQLGQGLWNLVDAASDTVNSVLDSLRDW